MLKTTINTLALSDIEIILHTHLKVIQNISHNSSKINLQNKCIFGRKYNHHKGGKLKLKLMTAPY